MFFFFLALLFPSLPALASENTTALSPWEGTWRGPCENQKPADRAQERARFEMEREISAIPGTNRMRWKSTYRSAERPDIVKDYELVAVDPARGRYQIDEKNGVLIDLAFSEEALYGHFAVADVSITSVERRRNEALEIELLTFRAKAAQEGAPVTSLAFVTNQKCTLTKVNP